LSSVAAARIRKSFSEAPWQLRASQLAAILRIEISKTLWMRRSIWIYLLAFAPALMFGIHALTSPMGRNCSIDEDTRVLAYTFQIFYLRVGIFFGCMGLFTWLFRGEIVEKSLHYYFLSPMRRELLVAGKFLAGVITASLVFAASVLLCFTFAYSHFGPAGRAFVFNGPGLGQLSSYLLVTVLACLGFGAIFLALSLIFKNPILPGIIVLLWESIHAVAPSLLQKFSVTFYLKQLSPVTIPPDGIMALFTVVAEPVSPWLAVPGLLALSGTILVYAGYRIRRTEISYLAD
jgi:ABC-type transport system involved in multi-copper enzyme maturation permease subunit